MRKVYEEILKGRVNWIFEGFMVPLLLVFIRRGLFAPDIDPFALWMGVLSSVVFELFIPGISTATIFLCSGDGFLSDSRPLLVLGISLLASGSGLLLDVTEDCLCCCRSFGDFSTMISDLVDIRPTDILVVTISLSLLTFTGSDNNSSEPLPPLYRRGCLFPITPAYNLKQINVRTPPPNKSLIRPRNWVIRG